jgi:hypothetical protein
MYDKDGERVIHKGKPLKRIGNTPCKTCPKKSPQEARHYELTNANRLALEFYYVTRAMRGRNLTDDMAQDGILKRNMATIDTIVRAFEARRAAMEATAPLLLGSVPTPVVRIKR